MKVNAAVLPVPSEAIVPAPMPPASPPSSPPPATAQEPAPARRLLRARFNRLRWWWTRHMAWPGVLALLLLTAAASMALVVRPALRAREADALRRHVVWLDDSARVRAASTEHRTDPREALRDALPAVSARGETLARLLRLVDDARLTVLGGEYKLEAEEPALVRMRVVLPVRGRYADVRALVAGLLNGFPNAALDSLEIERASNDEAQLNGHLRLSLLFRRDLR